MIKGYFHLLKYFSRVFLRNPLQPFLEYYKDINKDLSAKSYKSKYHLVWCVGLPKSGSTLIENILDELPYVRLNMSLRRLFSKGKTSHPHDLSNEMVESYPLKYYSYIKTHSHFDPEFIKIAKKNNAKVIVSIRDLRDMMISNFNHIKNNKDLWEYKFIQNLDDVNGFIKSLSIYNPKIDFEPPLEYYYKWIIEWKTYAENNDILLLWYEDYVKNPTQYINKILKYLDFDQFDAVQIESKLDEIRQKNDKSLKRNLKKPGREVSTFNEGKTAIYKSFFNKDIEKEFNKILSSNMERAFYE